MTRLKMLLVCCLISGTAMAQSLVVTGKVRDAQSSKPVPYATVVVHATSSGQVIDGATTSEDGSFEVPTTSPQIFLTVSFIGYQTDTLTTFETTQNGILNAGFIDLRPDQELLDEAVVTGEQSTVTFELDKRVFNVGKDLSTSGASALEVLNNVPSVNVNIEGEISLRGAGGVQILIDGKPSVLTDDASGALGSITADQIEKIEVITNPSAKYEASGTSGILNIVMKKDEKEGLNGSISINTGYPDNHSVGVSMNRRASKFNFFTQLGVGYRSNPRYSENINLNRVTGSSIESEGESFRNERFANITLGTDYHINEQNVITLSGRYAYEWERNPSLTVFTELDEDDVAVARWEREEITSADNPKWQFDLRHEKQFTDHKDHKLQLSAMGSYFGKDNVSQFTNTTTLGEGDYQNQRTNTFFERADYTFKLDYTHPFSEKVTVETGAQYVINDVGNDYAVRDLVNGEYVINESFTNDFDWDQKVLGVYVTGALEGEKAGLKLGLRAENTDLQTLLATTGESNSQNYTNFFPSVHTSYKITERWSAQAGYSRRVSRPRLWDLNPFFNITNNFNIRTGNPDLGPEFTDSYEVTTIVILPKASLNGSVYHRFTTDVVERVATFEDNVNTTSPENIGTNATLGFEVNGKYNPAKWWSMNGDFNYNAFQRRGEFQGTSFDFSGSNWSTRLSNKFKMPKGFEMEVTGSYRSGYKTLQGDVTGFPSADLGVRKKILKGKIVCNLGVRDVFASRIRETVIDQPDYYLFSSGWRGRFVTFGVSYAFGKGEAMSYSGGRRH